MPYYTYESITHMSLLHIWVYYTWVLHIILWIYYIYESIHMSITWVYYTWFYYTYEYITHMSVGVYYTYESITHMRLLHMSFLSFPFLLLQMQLSQGYPDSTTDNRTCILYSTCSAKDGGSCAIHYNNSGACQFIVGGFAIIAFASLAYVIVSIIRIIFSTK